MMYLFILVYTTPKFLIKLAHTKGFISKFKKDAILSEFYSPIEATFTELADGSLKIADASKHELAVDNGKLIVNGKGIKSGSFDILYNGKANFRILHEGKCLEAMLPSNKFSTRSTALTFAKCGDTKNQLWEIFVKSDIRVDKKKIKRLWNHKNHSNHGHTYHSPINKSVLRLHHANRHNLHMHHKTLSKQTRVYKVAS